MNKLITMDVNPFLVKVPEAELIGLHKRINATRWPERETGLVHCVIDHVSRFGSQFTFSVLLQLLYCVCLITINQIQK
jgi:hypothetical protein